MSHRSRLAQQRQSLQATPVVPRFPNVQPKPVPQQVTIDQLPAILMANGAQRGYTIQTSDTEPPIVRLNAQCGPLTLPLDFTPDEARKLAAGIMLAADTVDPPVEDEVVVSPEAEALLAEFIDAAEGPKCPGCDRPLKGHELTNVDGTPLRDSYYCFPCQSVIQDGVFVQAPPAPAESADTSWIHGTAVPA